jgi:hypothetical protein
MKMETLNEDILDMSCIRSNKEFIYLVELIEKVDNHFRLLIINKKNRSVIL